MSFEYNTFKYLNVNIIVMAEISLPEELIARMREHPEIHWDDIIIQTIKGKLEKLALANELAQNSTLTEEDAIEIGKLINKSGLKSYLSS